MTKEELEGMNCHVGTAAVIEQALNSAPTLIASAFTFSLTPQGYDHWAAIAYEDGQLTDEDRAWLQSVADACKEAFA